MGKSGRRGKEGGGRKPISTKRRHSGTGSSWKNRRSRSNRPSGGGYKNKGNNQNTGTGGTKQQNNNGLQPIRVNSSGIMSTWKKPLGGLIRYYVNNRVQNSHVDQTTAEDEVDRFYYRSNCNVEETKAAILVALGVTRDVIEKGCIGIDMAIEKGDDDQQGVNFFPISNDGNNNTETVDGRGIKLQQVFRPGEGPAHSNEQWTTIVVPEWAVGQPFFFQVTNFSSLNLSCELILDGEKVAFNAPLLPNSTRTIRPDTIRYYERHQWILNAAKKRQLEPTTATAHNATATHNTTTPPTPRYNGMRPDYKGQRINSVLYPDPTLYGWRFTGAVEESRVEFFEKRMNLGIVKLDFYYTTGTVKSTLHHPTTGRNQLFRTQVTPEQYVNVLKNPRAHTGQGYRHRENRPSGGNATTTNHQQEEDEFDRVPQQLPVNESEMDDASTNDDANTTYFAKDDRYDFKKQGHRNRIHQMNKLEQSRSYAEWKEASKQEYALIHAKFHVSIPKKMYNSGRKYNGDRSNQRRRGKQMNPLPLPEQQHVVNVKAAENCTLGTRYKSIGAVQRIARSNVRMERINGLTDDKQSRGAPVFEKKLYYRAENVVINGNRSDDEMMSEDEDDDEATVQPPTLAEYKTEKSEQVEQYHAELNSCIVDIDESDQRLRNVKNKISLAESIEDVDDVVKLFYNDLVTRQMR